MVWLRWGICLPQNYTYFTNYITTELHINLKTSSTQFTSEESYSNSRKEKVVSITILLLVTTDEWITRVRDEERNTEYCSWNMQDPVHAVPGVTLSPV